MTKEQRVTKQRLVSTANDLNAAPRTRIAAAHELVTMFGATARNKRVARSVISQLEGYTSASIGLQRAIRTEACKLEGLLERIDEGRTGEPDDDADNDSTPIGLDLLPPDGPDEFWDSAVTGRTRRALLGLAFGLPAFLPYTRADVVAALAASLHCPTPAIKFRPGRDDPPFQFSWIPYAAVRNEKEKEPS